MKWHHLVGSARLNGLWIHQRWKAVEGRGSQGSDGHSKGLQDNELSSKVIGYSLNNSNLILSGK